MVNKQDWIEHTIDLISIYSATEEDLTEALAAWAKRTLLSYKPVQKEKKAREKKLKILENIIS